MTPFYLNKRVWQNPSYFLAFGFGSGLLPVAPGTWGTIAAIPLYYLLLGCDWSVYLALVILAFAVGVVICEQVSKELGVHDYKGIVWDEVVGYLLTMFMAPQGWKWVVSGFLLFRLFDIWKPQPIGYIDKKIRGGLGVMLDDVLAGIYAWVVMHVWIWSVRI